MPDLENLPYTENGRAMPRNVKVGLLLTSAVLVALRHYHLIVLWYQAAMIPAYFVLIVCTLYHIIRNAVHEAIRLADADRALDAAVKAAVSMHTPPALSKTGKRELTAAIFRSHIEGTDA